MSLFVQAPPFSHLAAVSAFWDLTDQTDRLNGPPCHFFWDYEEVLPFSNLRTLNASVNTWGYVLQFSDHFPTYTDPLSAIYETVAAPECLIYQLKSFCCLLCLPSPHFLHNIKHYFYENADQGRLFCFVFSFVYSFVNKNCIFWAFTWCIFILTVYATVCVPFAVLLLWTLSALLSQVSLFFLTVLDILSCKILVICDNILLHNFLD